MIGSQSRATNTSILVTKPFPLKEIWVSKANAGREVTMDGAACAKALRQKEGQEVRASVSMRRSLGMCGGSGNAMMWYHESLQWG